MAKKITKKQAKKATEAAVENALEKYLSSTLNADEEKQTGDTSPLGTPYRRGSVTLRGKMVPRHSTTGKLISEEPGTDWRDADRRRLRRSCQVGAGRIHIRVSQNRTNRPLL